MRWLWRLRWRSLRRRVADLEERVAALEAGRPRIVQVSVRKRCPTTKR